MCRIGDLTTIQIDLRDGIGACTSQARTRRKAACWQGRTADRDPVIAHRNCLCNGHITGICDDVVIGHSFAECGKDLRAGCFRHDQTWHLINANRLADIRRCRRAICCAGCVCHHARIQIRLAHHVCAGAGQARAGDQTARRQGRAGHADPVIRDRNAVRDRNVTGIGDLVSVVDRIANAIHARQARRFDHGQ